MTEKALIKKTTTEKLRRRIRAWIVFVIIAIVASGVTAFPVESELRWLQPYLHCFPPAVADWLGRVYTGIRETNRLFLFLAYGYDWLAFAHLVIALVFVGPLREPVKNIWIIEWAMLCCVAVFPLAQIAGPIRSVPFFHQVVDCCFGLFGLVPLIIIRQKILLLRRAEGDPAAAAKC